MARWIRCSLRVSRNAPRSFEVRCFGKAGQESEKEEFAHEKGCNVLRVCDGLTEVETRRCAPDGTYNVMLYDNGGCSFPLPKCKPPERNPDGDDQRSNEKGTNC